MRAITRAHTHTHARTDGRTHTRMHARTHARTHARSLARTRANVCCSVLKCVAMCCSALQYVAVRCSALQCVAVRCSALQCVAVRCSALQCALVSRTPSRELSHTKIPAASSLPRTLSIRVPSAVTSPLRRIFVPFTPPPTLCVTFLEARGDFAKILKIVTHWRASNSRIFLTNFLGNQNSSTFSAVN